MKKQTKKNNIKNNIDKKKLWKIFDKNLGKNKLELLFSEEKKIREKCELCNSKLKVSDEKFLICCNDKCGIIYKDCLDQTAEWRYYGSEDNNMRDPTRCGMPINPLLKESSYACRVLTRYNSTYQMKKLKRYTDWQSMPYKEKSRYDEFEKIKLMSNIAGIPKIIVDEALIQHKNISEMKTFRSCNRQGIIAASIYVACRKFNYPRTPKEIAKIFHLDNSSATKGCKNASHILNSLEDRSENNTKTFFYQTKPKAFIERFCSKLNINTELTKLCLFVAMKIEREQLIPENNPQSVASGIIYFVSQTCNLNISKKNVNIASNTSEVTINKCFKKLEMYKDKLIPNKIIEKYSY